MRQIKASEIKPGMTIRWETGGITHECVVEAVTPSLASGAVDVDAVGDGYMRIERATLITVLSEPAPPQPEEPTAFGARVVAGGYEFLLSNGGRRPWKARLDGNRYSWAEVCGLGPVTIIDADPSWTLPAQVKVAPVVPERIEEWPKNDEHLRAYRWRDRDGDLWYSISDSRTPWVVGFADRTGAFHPYPKRGPFTRATDA